MKLSEFISLLALILACCSLWLHFSDYRKNRYKLRLRGFMPMLLGAGGEKFQVGVDVVNVGRRPISIVDVYCKGESTPGPDGGIITMLTTMHVGHKFKPIELGENQAYQFVTKEMKNKESLEFPEQIEIVVVDSNHKTYEIKIRNEALDFIRYEKESKKKK